MAKLAQCYVQAENLTGKTRIIQGDVFESDFGNATVVTLYLLPELNLKLLPKLLKDLKPGTRIVSHAFNMGSWKPEQTLDVGGRTIFYLDDPRTRHACLCGCDGRKQVSCRQAVVQYALNSGHFFLTFKPIGH